MSIPPVCRHEKAARLRIVVKDKSHKEFAPRCISIDLEVGVQDSRIHRFAAVRGDTGEAYVHEKGDLVKALIELDEFSEGAAFLLGHNLVAFDVPHLEALKPDLRILRIPYVDTLRLNPLAFPRNPYHHLVKHYQDGQLKRGRRNDPELDARLTLDVFADQQRAFREIAPELLTAWHWLITQDGPKSGLDSFFSTIRHKVVPSEGEARSAIGRLLNGEACTTQATKALDAVHHGGWPLAYALTWLSVAGGNSVMPPWVRHQFPEAGALVRRLRDTPCSDSDCGWCSQHHDARKELKRWFNLDTFRPEPVGENGRSMQELIVESAMRGEHILGILPTGTGKSVCYQLPALSRYDKTGALTVVISPLVALMADQVAGMEKRGITSCAAINGLLSMPERSDVLDRVRLGDIAILIVAPEQLRSSSVRKVLDQREIGAWVLDEAHCLSKWGHAFRPDYRYVGRFIREKARGGFIPPMLCLTATAKLDVVADIAAYFHKELAIDLRVFDGGTKRENLEFEVVPTSAAEKLTRIYQMLIAHLPPGTKGGAIVYCATRKGTEEVAQFLKEKETRAGYFHAGLQPETKKNVQERFINGDLQVIAATNAFGMGIDKPDVRLVVHADVPGSLENYLQEAGRAGRDRETARCVLLYSESDVESQFSMSARSRLTSREIHSVLRALRNIERKKRSSGEIVATAGEILIEDDEGTFNRDAGTDDTRVRTAVAWLEEATLLSREENYVQVFPSSLRVSTVLQAKEKLDSNVMVPKYRDSLLRIVEVLISADSDEGITTDELMGVSGLGSDQIRKALADLERLGIASNDTALTAYVHVGVERSSKYRFDDACGLEKAVCDSLREQAPDLRKGEGSVLNLRSLSHRLKESGYLTALPERLWRILRGLSGDGRTEEGGVGSIRLSRIDSESVHVTLQRHWNTLAETAERRRTVASRLLEHLEVCLPTGMRGTDLLAETTFGKLGAAIERDVFLKQQLKDPTKALERGLLWLHELEVIRLNKGLAVFRPAMTIRLEKDRKRGFGKSEFEPLRMHYDEQVIQIHVMAEYAERGLSRMADALRLTVDYFSLKRDDFIRRWLPGREKELGRQTTPESWHAIVESLNNATQQRIVTDAREETNVLVLAGPGSGKTRVLVHRIAYLVRVRRENPKGILALAYNRHAAVEIRRRLLELVGDEGRWVTVLTCHALAMRLAGVSLDGRVANSDAFREIIAQAIGLLKGADLPADEADEQRDRLLAGFRWILVDEYQDIGLEQYELISALAGRTLEDQERKLTLFAVGDDDQNIYAFNGASIEYIQRFEADYSSKPMFLTENYRSTGHIVTAANQMIESARNRMKAGHPITIDRKRAKSPGGGEWHQRDLVSRGRVQILHAGTDPIVQAVSVMAELVRLSNLDPEWRWSSTAVIAREWKFLNPIRAYCELNGIPVQMPNEMPHFWRLRETQLLVNWTQENKLITATMVNEWLQGQGEGTWWELLREATSEYGLEIGDAEIPAQHFRDWLAEWGREVRRKQTGLFLLTAHRAKGLEFDHVAVLDGNWANIGRGEDPDAPRRLYYVAMTRARQTLTLACFESGNDFLETLRESSAVLRRSPVQLPTPAPELRRVYERLDFGSVDLGFAGRQEQTKPVHREISELTTGAPLQLKHQTDRWVLTNEEGTLLGALARAYLPPPGMNCIEAKVAAIVVRYREDSKTEYSGSVRCDRWEVVIPELVFAPVSYQ